MVIFSCCIRITVNRSNKAKSSSLILFDLISYREATGVCPNVNTMEATMVGNVPSHLIFRGDGYEAWKMRISKEIRLSLRCPKVLVDIPVDESGANQAARLEQEDKAAGMLFGRLGDAQVLQVQELNTVREIFDHFDQIYGTQNNGDAFSVQAQLDAMQYNVKLDPIKFFVEFDNLIQKLVSLNVIVTDADKACRMLRTLPHSMRGIRQTCRGLLQIQGFTSNHVRNQIIQEAYAMQTQYQKTKRESPSSYNNGNGNGNNGNGTSRNGNGRVNGNGSRSSNQRQTDQNSCPNSNQKSHQPVTNGNGNSATACKATKKKRYQGNSFDIKKVKCFTCGQRGHFSNNCENKDQKSANRADFDSSDNESIKFAAPAQSNLSPREETEKSNVEMTFMGDSGCNYHITKENDDRLENVKILSGEDAVIRLAGSNQTMIATKQGDLPIISIINKKPIKGVLKDVLFVPEADQNFFSTTRFMSQGKETRGKDGVYSIYDTSGQLIIQGNIINKKIILKFQLQERKQSMAGVSSSESKSIGTVWHERFGHMNGVYVEKMPKLSTGMPTSLKVIENITNCDTCANAKQKRSEHNSKRLRATRILERIYCDIMGKITPMAEDESLYILVLVDDWSRYVVIYNLRSKDEASDKIMLYIRRVQSKFNFKVAEIRCDNGTEFVNRKLQTFCDEEGIELDLVPPETPELVAVVERKNGTLGDRIRALLDNSHVPIEWWNFAAETAVYLINRSPTSALPNQTPYELWHGCKPDVSRLRIFGSLARVWIPPKKRTKWKARSWKGIMVGYTRTGYLIYNVRTRETVKTCNVNIDESKDIRDLSKALVQNKAQYLNIEPKKKVDLDSIENIIITEDNVANMAMNIENPLTFEEAMNGPEKEFWKHAIEEELTTMKERKVWKIIPEPKSSIMDTKWVLKRKIEPDGKIRFRARLCAKGFKDKNKYVINEIYSPTAKQQAVRLLMILAVELDWSLFHLDVSFAFLYSDINKEVIISIPKGMNTDETKYALELQKSMYGLKISSHNWNKKISEILRKKKYFPIISEPCVYHNPEYPNRVILLIFVDDILITGWDKCEILKTIEFLQSNIEIRNLGFPKKFLGVDIERNEQKMTLKQSNYIVESTEKFPIGKASYSTPMEINLRLKKPDKIDERIPLREILGTIMYLAVCTRPDVSYAVNYLCRFQDTPTSEIFKYAKRILSYLFRTRERTMVYRKSRKNHNILTVMTDASFASDIVDRRSTSGILIKFGENTVHWRTIKQRCVTKSTSEAEYIAMSAGDSEVRAIQNILIELRIKHEVQMKVDNSGAIAIAENRDSKNCRHIDVAYRVVEEAIASGRYSISHLGGESMEADIFTKSLPKYKHEKFSSEIFNDTLR